jgi:hypothetical protein
MFEESSCQNCEEIQEEIQHHKLSDTSIRTDDSGQFSGSSANPAKRRPCSTRPPERPPTSFVQGDIFRGVEEVTTTVDFLYKGRFFQTDDDNGNEQ